VTREILGRHYTPEGGDCGDYSISDATIVERLLAPLGERLIIGENQRMKTVRIQVFIFLYSL